MVAGVDVLLRPSATVLSSTEVLKCRLLIVRDEIEGLMFCFLNVYAPNQGPHGVSFFTWLENELTSHHQDLLIVGGDFNCTLDFTMLDCTTFTMLRRWFHWPR